MASKWNADFIDLVDLMNAEQVELPSTRRSPRD
ncbi:MAG: hypothetical protein H6Q89_1235 [Myxococcaceae bacterium]|nr:hypothetical protein [Myxococcaceae bacterium]